MNCSVNENRTETNTPELISFTWSQSHSNANSCFSISFGEAECDNPAGHYLNCDFLRDYKDDERVNCCDIPIDDEKWKTLEMLLNTVQLPAYSAPDPYLMDATDSQIHIIRKENGSKVTEKYNGAYAHDFFDSITKLAIEISEQKTDIENKNV